MSVNNIADVLNADTFDTWRTKTNSIIAGLGKAVTLGDSETNTGNVVLNGDITLNTGKRIKADILKKTDAGSVITVESDLVLSTGSLDFNVTSGESEIDFKLSNTSKFKIATIGSHASLRISADTDYLDINSTTGLISTSSGLTLTNDSLPATVTRKIAHTGTGSSRSSFSECDITDGVINASKLTSDGTNSNKSVFAEVQISDGTIDGTSIGASTASTGRFSSINTTNNGHVTTNGSGQFRGDVANGSGEVIIDISSKTFDGEIGSTSTIHSTVINNLLKVIYPIGSLYTTVSDTNPGSNRTTDINSGLGFGTWERYAEGRVLLGKDDGQVIDSASTVNEGGSLGVVAKIQVDSGENHGVSVGERVFFAGITSSPNNASLGVAPTTREVVKVYNNTTFAVDIPSNQGTPAIGSYGVNSSSLFTRADSYFTEQLGGVSRETMNKDQMPSHRHISNTVGEGARGLNNVETGGNPQVPNQRGFDIGGSSTNSGWTSYVGGLLDQQGAASTNNPLLNMQPYITVNIWKRIS